MPVDNSFYWFLNLGSNDIDTGKFQFSCVNQSDVLLCFNLIRSNAVACVNMHPNFIRILLLVLLSYITYLFNSINTTSTFPLWWKCAKILPIPNIARSIGIVCYLSKVLRKILNSQMASHIDANKLLTENHSCVSALLDVSENIRHELDIGKLNFLVLLDHS